MGSVRRIAFALVLGVLAFPAAAGAGSATFKATLIAPGHTPKVLTKWHYVVTAADLHGKPIAARLTMTIKDPTGSVHPVQYAATKKNITNWPIKGRFTDYIIWPADSKLASIVGGLVLRAKVTVNGKSVTLSYRVKPR
jgi:hypothetical protein